MLPAFWDWRTGPADRTRPPCRLASSRRASQVTSKDGFFRDTPESERYSCLGATLSPPLYLDRGEEDNTGPTDAAFFANWAIVSI
jgi:hypothetical protein